MSESQTTDPLRQGRAYIATATRDGSDIVVIQDLCSEIERLRTVLRETWKLVADIPDDSLEWDEQYRKVVPMIRQALNEGQAP